MIQSLRETIKEAEKKRVHKFAMEEAARVTSQVSVVSKSQLDNVKKKLRSIDKELSSRGKSTLKSIMKQLSK